MKNIDKIAKQSGVVLKSDHEKIQFASSLEFIDLIDFKKIKKIADVGAGPGNQAKYLSSLGLNVTCIDYVEPRYDLKWLLPTDASGDRYDAIWSHHCLEHIPDPVSALVEWKDMLNPGGKLFLTVPEIGLTMSSGHINSFNLPLLMYQLAMAGFNCSAKQFTKVRSHLRIAVTKSKKYSPSSSSLTRSLSELASYGLFPPSVTTAIKESGRFSAKDMHLNWFGKELAPNLKAEESYDFITSNLWG